MRHECGVCCRQGVKQWNLDHAWMVTATATPTDGESDCGDGDNDRSIIDRSVGDSLFRLRNVCQLSSWLVTKEKSRPQSLSCLKLHMSLDFAIVYILRVLTEI